MPMQIQCAKDRATGKSAVIFQSTDVVDAHEMCRLLKRAFPDIYREIWYEITPPQGKQFEIPESVNDANND